MFQKYGRLDVLIYNSGAIWWSAVETTPMKRFQLMQRVNPEGLYGTVQAALPHFKKNGWKGRIIVVSPPIYSRFFRGKTAYAMGKVGMSVLTKGLAVDFEREGRTEMAITSIWPAVVCGPCFSFRLETNITVTRSLSGQLLPDEQRRLIRKVKKIYGNPLSSQMPSLPCFVLLRQLSTGFLTLTRISFTVMPGL